MISRPLRTTKGENTSAAWGVVNFLLRLREKYGPDYVVWVNDAGSSFREERYPEYKSTREKLDEELQADFDRSVERISELLAAFRIPLVAVQGYEADDVIATLATQAAARGLQAVIVSGDKDFYQLIGPRIALLNPGRGGPAGVEETWVDESQRLRAARRRPLAGRGLPGARGRQQRQHPGRQGRRREGGAEAPRGIRRPRDDPRPRRRGHRQAHPRGAAGRRRERAALEELVTIKRDVPVELDLDAMRVGEPDFDALRRILTELEFFRWRGSCRGR